MTFQGKIEELQDAVVVDRTGDKVGKVGQVYLDNDSGQPSWVTVNTGLFGTKESFIPLTEASHADGTLTVPYEKSFIKDAPNLEEHGELGREQEGELYSYYGVGTSAGNGNGNAGDRRRDGDRTDPRAGQHRDARADATGTAAGTAAGGVGGNGVDGNRPGADTRTGADARPGAGNRPDADARPGTDRHADAAGTRPDRADAAGRDGGGVTLHEERVDVGTERVETGRARLRKHVVTDTEHVEVPVQREEVVLEREPVDGRAGGSLSEEEVEVTLSEERPVVQKETVATEKVSLGKRTVRDTEGVDTEVSHEEVDVDGLNGERPRDAGQDRPRR